MTLNNPTQVTDNLNLFRKRYLRGFVIAMFLLSIFIIFGAITEFLKLEMLSTTGLISVGFLSMGFYAFIWFLVAKDQLRIASYLMLIQLSLTMTLITPTNDNPTATINLMGIFILCSAITLLDTFWASPFIAYTLLFTFLSLTSSATELPVTITTLATLLIPAIILRFILNNIEQFLFSNNFYQQVLATNLAIGEAMIESNQLDQLLTYAARLLYKEFEFYGVQIYLLDENREFARLAYTTITSSDSRMILDIIPMASNHAIIRAIKTNMPMRSDENHLRRTNLPVQLGEARSQLVIPISNNNEAIGALDIYSKQPNTFNSSTIQGLQTATSQLSIGIRNALYAEQQLRSLEENRRLFEESENSLREIQRLNRQLTRDTWAEYLKNYGQVRGITVDGKQAHHSEQWTPTMTDAVTRRRSITTDLGQSVRFSVPIILRGEILGVIETDVEKELANSQTQLELLDALSNRVATSLETARLFEETQASNAQEQRINEIVDQYQTANSVDELLQITLKELQRSLGAEEGMIRLGQVHGNAGQNGASEG